jgi:ATP-binding cassette subfamily C (CFTR/MRP) protein 1
VSCLIRHIHLDLTKATAFNLSLSQFVTGWTVLETSLGAIARLKDFETETKVEAKEGEYFDPPENWPARGLIQVDKVTAAYKFVCKIQEHSL